MNTTQQVTSTFNFKTYILGACQLVYTLSYKYTFVFIFQFTLLFQLLSECKA